MEINLGTVTSNIISIYHPPYSNMNQSTNAMFLHDQADIFEKHIMSLSNIVMKGDFNLHMDEMDDSEVNFSSAWYKHLFLTAK